MQSTHEWLDALELGEFAEAFEVERIQLRQIPKLTEADLKELGLPMGPRKVILEAAQQLAEANTLHEEASKSALSEPQREAERRQITIMFCDLVGSTALSETLDPEELRDVMQAYRKACSDVIERYDGHVAQYLGDGVMVYFGWPAAHEDDAGRAVRAGLDIVDGVATLELEAALAVRIGIATGLVVVGDSGADEGADAKLAVGETPNVAARIQGLAAPGTVAIAQNTRRLLGSAFALDDLGIHDVKGVSGGLHVHRVLGTVETESRFEASQGGTLSPLVGRDAEMALLAERWGRAKAGEGQVVLVSGEPGIGKSRLMQALREATETDRPTSLRFQCSPYHTNSALHPVIEQIKRAASFRRDDTQDQKLDKLEALLTAPQASTNGADRTLALFAAMLSLPVVRYSALGMSPQKQKEETLAAIHGEVGVLADAAPVLLLFEDAHWIDPTSQEALDLIVPGIEKHRALAVITYRPEYEPPWLGQGHVLPLAVRRLGQAHAAAMIDNVSDTALSVDVRQQIIAKTDGVPLFVEELTKTVNESGAETANAIPETLQDSLMARLDRLSPVKEVAQIGACIGREFDRELLAAVSPLGNNELADALQQLVNSELIYRSGNQFIFKHALVQDAAYESLLKSRRQQLHGYLADGMIKRFPDYVESVPETIAHHLTEANLPRRAVPFWLRAGQLAVERSAFVDAMAHLRKGLDQLETLSPSADRDRQELDFQVLLMPIHITITGWVSDALAQTASRARELAERFEEFEMLNGIWHVLWMVRCAPARYPEALDVAEQAVKAGELRDESAFRVVGHFSAACTHGWLGEFSKSQDELRAVVAEYDFDNHSDIVWSTNHDPLNSILSYWCHFHWITGYPDQARRTAFEQIEMARRLNHPFNTIWALSCGGCAFVYCNEPERFSDWIAEATKIADDQALSFAMAFISAFSGMGLIWSGHHPEGYAKIAQCVETFSTAGINLMVPMYQTNMGDALGYMGRADEGLELIERAIAMTNETGERFYAAETYRVKGDLLLANGRESDAENAFHESLGIAVTQESKGWELRAATSLARLWQSQGKRREADELLTPVYDWFTEGFDTPDLKEAKALLDELK
jgi:class 3 adenylate cyclase/tetratricopeptide (TPR) repeat protein